MQVFKEYCLTMVEKETLKIFLKATLNGDKIIILSAQDISEQLLSSQSDKVDCPKKSNGESTPIMNKSTRSGKKSSKSGKKTRKGFISRPRAYAILKNLESKEILENYERKGFVLTDKGETLIHESKVKKILETYFYQVLKFSLEDASNEASSLSIYSSSLLINTLCERVGMPKECPHGIPITHDLDTHKLSL